MGRFIGHSSGRAVRTALPTFISLKPWRWLRRQLMDDSAEGVFECRVIGDQF